MKKFLAFLILLSTLNLFRGVYAGPLPPVEIASPNTSGSANLGALNTGVLIPSANPTESYATAIVTITGTWSGTLSFTYGGGKVITGTTLVNGAPTGAAVSSTTSNGSFAFSVSGLGPLTITMTSFVSGTATVSWAMSSFPILQFTSSGGPAATVNQGTNPWITDPIDRAGRLLGVIYGSQGQQLKQTAVNFNTQVELATGGTLYDSRQIRALASGTDTVTVVQPTGTNLHAVIDSGSTTVVTGNVTVVQGTASNLKALVTTNADQTVAPGAVANNSLLIGGQFNTTQPTLTNTQGAALQFTNRGEVLVSPGTSGFIVTGSGNFTVVQPTGTNLHTVTDATSVTNATLQTSAGTDIGKLDANQSVNVTQLNGTTQVTAGVAGTQAVGGNQATGNNIATNTNALLMGGSDYGGTPKLQNLKVDSSGHVYNNLSDGSGNAITSTGNALDVNLKTSSITVNTQGTLTNNNAAPSTNNLGVLGYLANAANPTFTEGDLVTGSIDLSGNERVKVNAPLPAGTNVIGHVIADSGSTTAVTGNVTVVQPTGTNLHAVLDTTSTTAVTQATASNLNATIVGTLTHNNAAPSTNNLGVLPAKANAAAQTYTEGDQVLLSTDLNGWQRTTNPTIGSTGATAPTIATEVGYIANTVLPTAVTAGQLVAPFGDPFGRLITIPQGPRGIQTTSALTITDNSPHNLFASQGAGVFCDIEWMTITNSSTTADVATLSDGTTSYNFAIAPTGGIAFQPAVPVPAASAATAWTLTMSASVSSIYANAGCVKNK